MVRPTAPPEDYIYVGARGHGLLAKVYGAVGEAEANARLIAAAPDLLAECRRMLTDLEKHIGPVMEAAGIHPPTLSIKSLRAAIAKATGAEVGT